MRDDTDATSNKNTNANIYGLPSFCRHNPDVIMAGTNLYDVMYHQHFFGSHKLIPLPAVGEYVRARAHKGNIFMNDKCTAIFLLEENPLKVTSNKATKYCSSFTREFLTLRFLIFYRND